MTYRVRIEVDVLTDGEPDRIVTRQLVYSDESKYEAVRLAATETLNCMATLARQNWQAEVKCDHHCSCKDTFCCVCDRKAIEDDQAYNAGYACMMRPIEDKSHD